MLQSLRQGRDGVDTVVHCRPTKLAATLCCVTPSRSVLARSLVLTIYLVAPFGSRSHCLLATVGVEPLSGGPLVFQGLETHSSNRPGATKSLQSPPQRLQPPQENHSETKIHRINANLQPTGQHPSSRDFGDIVAIATLLSQTLELAAMTMKTCVPPNHPLQPLSA